LRLRGEGRQGQESRQYRDCLHTFFSRTAGTDIVSAYDFASPIVPASISSILFGLGEQSREAQENGAGS